MESEKSSVDIQNSLKDSVEKVRKIAADLDHKIKENPWPAIAGVAVVSLLIGFIMGRARDKA